MLHYIYVRCKFNNKTWKLKVCLIGTNIRVAIVIHIPMDGYKYIINNSYNSHSFLFVPITSLKKKEKKICEKFRYLES